MEIDRNEREARTVWRKYLRHNESGGSFGFGGAEFAGVFCVREVSGYAVWYRRCLDDARSDSVQEDPASLDGQYLLKFFAPQAKHEAIEFAVLVTLPGADAESAIASLDSLAAQTLKLNSRSDRTGPIESVT